MDAITKELSNLLAVTHRTIEQAIDGLPDEALDWSPGEGLNSLGVLLAHTFGAERFWIGDVAGQEPSGRVRESEFMIVGVGVSEFIDRSKAVLAHSQSILAGLTPESFAEIRQVNEDGRWESVAWSVLHALEHTALHAGHIQITRQLWDARPLGLEGS